MYDIEIIVYALIMGLLPAFIAKKKGRSFSTWYIYGVFLWIIALIHSLCMKDKSGMQCPACKEWIAENAVVCKHCHTVIADFYRQNQQLVQDIIKEEK